MIFPVHYDQDDQIINLPEDIQLRVNKLVDLKNKGYTHIDDKWMTMYTGSALITIDSYITETESYL